ncbi:Rpp14/Pop5 family protein [Halorubrum ezzemoulense]|uniref:Ribonuclease P protein component 2 n=2 Tax=Halorubrum ezzemoulense TaxID=337243 RepID=A0A256K1A5_HALEZ|nr:MULTISPECIES: Rpp14/Pop5 family protein [Halorubrum]MDB2237245.1 Rpp14/Pop5 family protein [Halorubrum ezzemoulense]MDB2245458.1 Rpp14/Pop5 family protein [Halorubrum ezzemoulense]MDB2246805.1 Rpp14/Pop5 family protein [Halorubrum ezzemoulense]MDB2250344.1 Rpp14/Pop5 family protein [Halorubrum ezzemoulense]MDB2259953.1 Rpp14/Pop5 family protein [Halorubrum ezzemoulense]
MKHLPKHLRPRWRYLAVGIETWPDAEVGRRAFQRALWYSAGNLLGDAGSADADLTLLSFAHADGTGEAVVRVRHGHVDEARAAVACVSEVDGEPVGIRVRGISGTVRACEERYMGRATASSTQRDVAFEGSERPAVVRGDACDVETESDRVGATTFDTE